MLYTWIICNIKHYMVFIFINYENYTKQYIDKKNKSFIDGFNGASASVSSTLILNPIHALKTYRQTKHLSYVNSVRYMIDKTSIINSLYRVYLHVL